jgi:glycosyltransferase involved in cell wall biosynthesis
MTPIEHLNLHMECRDPYDKQKWRRYYLPVHSLSEELPAPILGIMLLIWQIREADLQEKFPLDDLESRLGFLTWCICHGRNEYKALAEAEDFWELINTKAVSFEFPRGDPGNAISTYMLIIKEARSDLPFNLSIRTGRSEFVLWYLTHGRYELGIQDEYLPMWQASYLASNSDVVGLNCLQQIVYESRPDLQIAFPNPAESEDYLQWYKSEFAKFKVFAQSQLLSKNSGTQKEILPKLLKGVNVIGYAFGQLGIGEDARMAAKSLILAGINTTLINFKPGDTIPQNDFSMTECVGDDICFNVNIFCLTALETGRYFAERGSKHFSRTFNIGYWPWELESWPAEWVHLFVLIDEVWASSMHTYKSIFSNSNVPVKHMPMAVMIPEESCLTREDFGLPPDATLFLFSFDLNSTAKRKNPTACVKAFLQAFPFEKYPATSRVGLVIKVHAPTKHNDEWQELLVLHGKDPRIHLIQSTLSKQDLLALYKMCDCFISLHRAEGFGRNIAESMLLGTPVITTAYSGNMDYTNNKNSYLVGYRLVNLDYGDYPYGQGKFWADPDIEQASLKMRQVFDDINRLHSMALRAQKEIVRQYDSHSVGARYHFELQRIFQIFC